MKQKFKSLISALLVALLFVVDVPIVNAQGTISQNADSNYTQQEMQPAADEAQDTEDEGEKQSTVTTEDDQNRSYEADDSVTADTIQPNPGSGQKETAPNTLSRSYETVPGWNVISDTEICYCKESGDKVTGIQEIDGYVYSFDDNGNLKLGFQSNVNGKSYLYINEDPYIALNYEYKTSEGTRYFGEFGEMLTGAKKIGNDWYRFDKNGFMYISKWYTDGNNNKYYYDSDGKRVSGSLKISGSWYYFNPEKSGAMLTGWRTSGTKKYYYNTNGKKVTGEKKISGSWYYLNPNKSGAMLTGWRTSGTKKYYYNTNGKKVTGTKKINGSSYYFNPKKSGAMQTGWATINGKKYYYNSKGKKVTGYKKINGSWYYLNPNKSGAAYTGWKTINGTKYYFQINGKRANGNVKINGTWYFFNSNGTLTADQTISRKAQQYSSSTQWLILVNTSTNRVAIFKGSKNKWVRQKYWYCTSGKSSTPTVKGQFTVGSRGKSFGKGYTCWYWTQFYGDYLFHSVLYQQGSMSRIQDGRLGINASHGCIRLNINNAKWIYDNIPRGTKVVAY